MRTRKRYLVSQQVSSDRLLVYRCPSHSDGCAVDQEDAHIQRSLQWDWGKRPKTLITNIIGKSNQFSATLFYHLLRSSRWQDLAQVPALSH